MCSSKVFDIIDSSSIIISFKSDSAILICVFCWSEIGVILSPDSLGVHTKRKNSYRINQYLHKNLDECKLIKQSLIPTESLGERKYASSLLKTLSNVVNMGNASFFRS